MNGVLYGLLAALAWGCSDFTGGAVTRKHSPIQVMLVISFTGAIALGGLAVASGEGRLTAEEIAWATGAGICGGLGLALFYAALAVGPAGLVAPIAGVVGAALPVVLTIFGQGWPGAMAGGGLLLGLAGIWLASSAPEEAHAVRRRTRSVGQAIAAGVLFGLFLATIGRASSHSVFMPLMVSKLASSGAAMLLLGFQRPPLPALRLLPLALLGGMLDVAGDLFYVWAQQNTRMDIAVTIASMYPVATVVLAMLIYRERPAMRQAAGALMCLAALVLIVQSS
jgi:drug/metabolite transporter (DMT)-like permease